MKFAESDELLLEREAIYFHYCFFRKEELSEEVIARYVNANQMYLSSINYQKINSIEQIINRQLDVEAIEYVFRIINRKNILTTKIQILFYLIEVRSQYFEYFFNCRADRLRALASFTHSLLLAAFKFVKGKYLIWKYDLV